MRKLIITVLAVFFLITPSWCGGFASLPIDYVLHGLTGATLQGLMDNWYPDSKETNFKIVCGIGIAKEVYDMSTGGYFDIAEAGAVMLGAYIMRDSERNDLPDNIAEVKKEPDTQEDEVYLDEFAVIDDATFE